jgi:DNA-binding XRE family transcriptional regulator
LRLSNDVFITIDKSVAVSYYYKIRVLCTTWSRLMSVRKTIRELREQHGWTQLQLANKLGVTPATVYTWERGIFDPRASQLRKLARVFEVSMDAIALAGDEQQEGKAAA